MKGIAHFITGLALATLFPEVVHRAAGGSLLPVLGGIAGLLPDTLDFKFARYFEVYDEEIDPGPEPDPGEIARRLVTAMRRAFETNQPQRVLLHTVRLGADLWRQYFIRFDAARNEVAVRVGPVVTTAQVVLAGSRPASAGEVRLGVGVPLVHTYDAESQVDIFSGPSFRFVRKGGLLHIQFLDWHRRWSHSLTLALLLGLVSAGVSALVERSLHGVLTAAPLWVGLVAGVGIAGHILEDQLGCMGSNLFYPFTRERTGGLRLLRSGDGIPNLLTVWTAGALTLLNLDRFSGQPRLDTGVFLLLAVGIPLAVLGGLYWLKQQGQKPQPQEPLRQREIVAESEEVIVG